MTRTAAAPSPDGGDDKIRQTLSLLISQMLRDTPVTPPGTTSAPHPSTNGSSPSTSGYHTELVNEVWQLALDHIRRERRRVKLASAVYLVGMILLWAGLIIGIALEVGLLTWLGWEITHPLHHPDLFPPIISSGANLACSGVAACLVRRFGWRRSRGSASRLEVGEALLNALRNFKP